MTEHKTMDQIRESVTQLAPTPPPPPMNVNVLNAFLRAEKDLLDAIVLAHTDSAGLHMGVQGRVVGLSLVIRWDGTNGRARVNNMHILTRQELRAVLCGRTESERRAW